MNANELADGILAIEERIFLTKKEHQLFQNSATMLRQQQAKIEALKLQLHTTLTNRDLRTYDGKTEMNNEPVAYVDNVWINRPDLAMDLGIGQMFSRCQLSDHQIPLYTHPVKELPNNHQYIAQLEMTVRNQQAEIEALKAGKIRAYDNGVEDGRKPNTNLVKELTDDKIAELIKATNDEIGMKNIRTFDFTKVLLRKAQEK